jgi:predicted NBD/HSP70 family sugar kinase
MKCPAGHSVEKYVSSQGIQSIYGEIVGKTLDELHNEGIFPPQIRARALNGEAAAVQTMQAVAHYMALLLYERITSLYAGWQGFLVLIIRIARFLQRNIISNEYYLTA